MKHLFNFLAIFVSMCCILMAIAEAFQQETGLSVSWFIAGLLSAITIPAIPEHWFKKSSALIVLLALAGISCNSTPTYIHQPHTYLEWIQGAHAPVVIMDEATDQKSHDKFWIVRDARDNYQLISKKLTSRAVGDTLKYDKYQLHARKMRQLRQARLN